MGSANPQRDCKTPGVAGGTLRIAESEVFIRRLKACVGSCVEAVGLAVLCHG